MKSVKDNFSNQAQQYAAFRPRYPASLFDFLYSKVKLFNCAWDCGTGNGQVAEKLADRFAKVYATDISAKQLQQAAQKNNIVYSLERAEKTGFADDSFDLITIAQAIHWFDLDLF